MIKRVYGARDYEGRFASWPRVPSKRRPLGPALWMETMFLVAGLAVAGLVGIAAAFYFSIRSGNRGGKRLRSTRPDLSRPNLNGHPRRTADDARPVTTFRPAASPKPRRAEAARTRRRSGPGDSPTRRHCPRTRGRVTPRPGIPGPTTLGRMTRYPMTRPPPTRSWVRPRARPAKPGRSPRRRRPGRPSRAAARDSAREPTSTRNCGRPSRSAASATSSSGMILRRTSRSPAPRVPPSRNRRAGTGCPVPRLAPGSLPAPLATLLLGSTRGRPPARRPSKPRRATGNAMSGVPAGAGGAGIRPRAPCPTRRPNGPRYSPPTRRPSRSRP